MCRESWWGRCPWIVFSQMYFTFFMIYPSRLRFVNLFFQCGLLCLFFVGFFSKPDVVNITWFTGHIHRSIVDKIGPTSEDVERVKIPYQLHWVTYFCEMWSEEFIYRAFNWSVKNIFDAPWQGHPLFISSKVEWLMMTFVMENCLLVLFVVLDLDLEPISIDNSFLSLKTWS